MTILTTTLTPTHTLPALRTLGLLALSIAVATALTIPTLAEEAAPDTTASLPEALPPTTKSLPPASEAAPAPTEATRTPSEAGASSDTPAPGQDASSKTSVPEETATRVGELDVTAPPVLQGVAVDRYGNATTTVSQDQIEALDAQDLSNAVRRVPGVVISRYNFIGAYGGGDGGSIFIRGLGSSRPGAEISTMIDGVPRHQGVFSHPILDNFNLDMVSRIEIQKSARPVTNGGGFAAVNLVPKQVTTPDFTASASAQYGVYDTALGRMENGAKVGAFDYYVVASYRESQGHRLGADGRLRGLYGRIGYELSPHWYASAFVDHTDGDVGDPGAKGAPVAPIHQRFESNDDIYVAKVANTFEDFDGELKFSYQDGLIHWRQWDFTGLEPFDSISDYGIYGLRVHEKLRPWKGGEFVLGYDQEFRHGKFVEDRESGDRYDTKETFYDLSPYFLLSHAFRPSGDAEGALEFIPSGGFRYDVSRYFEDEPGGQAGLRVRYRGTEFHANYAHGFNYPGIWAAVFYTQWNRGEQWKDLAAETLDHVELGVSRKFSDWIEGDLTGFYDDVENAILFVPPPPPPPIFANIGNYHVFGAEATVTVHPVETLEVFGGATFMNPTPSDVPNVPEWSFVLGANANPIDKLQLSADLEWVDRRYVLNPRFSSTSQVAVDSYVLLNARAAYSITRNFKIFVAGENLTDSDYEYRPGYPMPGATVLAGIELSLDKRDLKRLE